MVAKLKNIASNIVSVLIFITVGSTIGLLAAGFQEYGETLVYIMLGESMAYYLLNK
jgi:hypothetical protein